MATVQHQVITTIDELVDPVASARMRPLVLRAGAIRAEWARTDLDGVFVEVGNYSFPVTTSGETMPDRLTFLTPLRRVQGQLNGEAVVPGLLHAYGRSAEVRGGMTSAATMGVLSVPMDALEHAATAMGVDLDLPEGGEFRAVDGIDWERLHAQFDDTAELAIASPGATLEPRLAHSLRSSLLEITVRSFDRGAKAGRRAPHHVNDLRITRACEDYAASTQYQDVTLASLCQACGMSERRVRQAFHECYGLSPTAFLRIAALHSVRHQLLEGPPQHDAVSRAASDFGFWHLSRFAGQYRALFGESPSTTLLHRAGAAATG